MVANEIWDRVVPEDPHTMQMFLCVGCLEGRLGRMLQPIDFTDVPLNDLDFGWKTDRLDSRLTGRAEES